MAYTKRQIEEYQRIEFKLSEVTGRHTDEIRSLLDRLHRYETTLQRINENDCNGHPRMKVEYRDGKMFRYEVEDERWAARDAKKEASIKKRAVELLAPYNIKVQFNGDPRGGAIRMMLPDHTSNNWDQETWGIYW